jgi:hypothetical protein
MPGPKPVPIEVTDAQMQALQTIVHKRDEPHILVMRAWIILLAHLGHATRSIARDLHVSEDCVTHWKQRWREQARTGVGETNVRLWLTDAPRSGEPPSRHHYRRRVVSDHGLSLFGSHGKPTAPQSLDPTRTPRRNPQAPDRRKPFRAPSGTLF